MSTIHISNTNFFFVFLIEGLELESSFRTHSFKKYTIRVNEISNNKIVLAFIVGPCVCLLSRYMNYPNLFSSFCLKV